MNTRPLTLTEPPELSGETAAQILDLLYQLTDAFEFHYYDQIREYYKPKSPPDYDLIPDFDDHLPDF